MAWFYNLLYTTFLLFSSGLILSPEFRQYSFRRRSNDSPTLDQTPPSGPANAEKQASHWATSVQDLITSMTVSPGPSGGGGSQVSNMVHEEVNGVMVDNMKKRSNMNDEEIKGNRKEVALELYGKPMMRIIGGMADKWERIAKYVENESKLR